ncbi:single-stranded DNA-binding protein [Paracoccaceae bacterium GXU_MW_L88]
MNKHIILGNLTRDPELKALPSGSQVCNFAVATNRTYKDKDGNTQEKAQFHNVVVFGAQAEACSKYLAKGRQALVEGRSETRTYEVGEEKRYITELIADNVTFVGKAPSKVGDTDEKYPEQDINPEDIPF